MNSKNLDTPLWRLTVKELLDIIKSINTPESLDTPPIEVVKDNYEYGLDGLARVLGCSKSHASKLKSKGIFDDAIVQNGRKIIINKNKALELFNQNK